MTEQDLIEWESICNPDKYIPSEEAKRKEYLLKKSMSEVLTNEEYEEFKTYFPSRTKHTNNLVKEAEKVNGVLTEMLGLLEQLCDETK